MAIRRSPEMWLAAYFLSRCGQHRPNGRSPSPPPQLGESWEEAYSLFFLRLHGGRSLSVFHHSMKNARDMFDGHLNSGRVGWREVDAERPPQSLNPDAGGVMAEWEGRSDAELWQAVEPLTDFRVRGLSAAAVEQLVVQAASTPPANDFSAAEGRELLRLHRTRERNGRLVARKKRAVMSESGRLVCEACDFDFAAAYGPRGEGFAECHHTHPISRSVPGRRTRLFELAVVCANCHRMLHRRPWVSLAELWELVRSRRE